MGEVDAHDAKKVERVVLCSGKVYYDLLEKRRAEGREDIAIVAIEQLYPFPEDDLAEVLAPYKNLKHIVWCQEEPMNQGAWYCSQHHMRRVASGHKKTLFLEYAGRDGSAAPACGYASMHAEQQDKLLHDAFTVNAFAQQAAGCGRLIEETEFKERHIMAIEIKALLFPESVADGTVATWHKQPGDVVKRDELIVDIETDKVVIEVLAEADGVLAQIIKNEGDTVLSNELLGTLNEGGAAAAAPAVAAQAAAPAAAAVVAAGDEPLLSPAARKIAEENGIDPSSVVGTGKGGRVSKEDVVAAVEAKKNAPVAAAAKPAAPAAAAPLLAAGDRVEKRVPMTRLRAKVAERLVEAQSNMAMLTTFNEVDMTEVMALRAKYKDLFEKTHNGVRLGFMSSSSRPLPKP